MHTRYREAERAWYIILCTTMELKNGQKILKHLHIQHLVGVVSYLVSSLFMLFWAPYAHIIKPFLLAQDYVPGHPCFSILQETESLAAWE